MKRVITAFRGQALTARILRSTSWVIVGHAGAQAIRLGSNLILTRILFPEAFGLMSLVTMVTVGLMMFSDVGIGPALARSPRGDDPAFLDTAWTLASLRGIGLWLVTLALAWPVARFYGEPDLALYLPVAGLSLVIAGMFPTRMELARRHLQMGRVTILDLLSQLIGLSLMVALALWTGSVMALVLGGVLSNLARLVLMWRFLPGHVDRPRIEPAALHELVHFGKWVFLGTAFAFVTAQGDKAVLGKLLSLDLLGIYNIAFFLASFPMMLGQRVTGDLMIPIYRNRPPWEAPENRRKLARMRMLLTGGLCALLLTMAYAGPPLVDLLYDDRYALAGPMIVLIAWGLTAQAVGLSYDHAALAAGDSRGAFVYTGARAVAQIGLLIAGLMLFGLVGGILSYGVAMLAVHPVLIRLARRHKAWDPAHDALWLAVSLVLGGGAVWLHRDAVASLAGIGLAVN